MKKTTLLLGPDALARLSKISGNIDIDYITPSVYQSQITDIKRILTTPLYSKIVADFSTDSLTGEYKILYDEFIVDMLTYFSISNYIKVGSYTINQSGIFKSVADNTTQLDIQEITLLAKNYESMANSLEQMFVDFMKNTSIPEYTKEQINNGSNGLGWYF